MTDLNKHRLTNKEAMQIMPMHYMKKEAKYMTDREENKKKKAEDLFKQAFNSEPIVVKKEKTALDSSEILLESSIEEGQSYIEEDVKADVKSALERLNSDKLIMLERKVRTLERNIKTSLDEKKSLQIKIDTLELEKVENDLRVMELEEQLKFQEEMLKISTEDAASNATEKGAPEMAEIGVQTENSYSEMDITVKKEGTEVGIQTGFIVDPVIVKEVSPEVTETGAQTECAGNPYDFDNKDGANASDGLKDKLEEAYKIVVMQESSLQIKEKEICLLRKKIRDWGLEDKISEESTSRRRSAIGVREDVKNEDNGDFEVVNSGVKRRASSLAGGEAKLPKTPKKDIKVECRAKLVKTPKKGLKEIKSEMKDAIIDDYEEDELIIPDTDPKHPTSSFNLRKKGRNHRGKKPLMPMGHMLGPFTGNIENIIVDKGDDPKHAGVNRYFAIRRGEKSKLRNRDCKTPFRNPGPRVSSWKEYRSKYVN